MKYIVSGIVVAVLMAGGTSIAIAQGQGQDHAPILIPDSSVEKASEHGVAALRPLLLPPREQLSPLLDGLRLRSHPRHPRPEVIDALGDGARKRLGIARSPAAQDESLSLDALG